MRTGCQVISLLLSNPRPSTTQRAAQHKEEAFFLMFPNLLSQPSPFTPLTLDSLFWTNSLVIFYIP